MEISVSKAGLDPEWDRFLANVPDGCYQQSSLWAKVKSQDWKHLRMVVREHGEIIGGVQILLSSLPLFGTVGYVPKGPVIASNDQAVQEFILDQLGRLARKEHVLFLKIQPPQGAESLGQRLLQKGALPSAIPVTPLATVLVDLRPKPDDILAQMGRSTRYNIRRSERQGVSVRLGTEEDIPIFYHLSKVHAEQRGYHAASEAYLHTLWSTLAPGGHFCLFLAEYEGQVIAARTNIAFGDIMLAKFLVDDGQHRKLNAPSLLHWKAMLWGKEHGYNWYNFAGIKMDIARKIMDDKPIPDTSEGHRAQYKLSFGGQLMLRPGVYDVSYVWPSSLTVRMVPLLLKIKPLLSFMLGGSLSRYTRMHDRAAKRANNNPKQARET